MAIKRLGLQVDDPDLEARLQRIEAELEARALANIEGSQKAQLRSGLTNIKEIEDLELISNIPGAITARWKDSRLRDLRYYEVELSNNIGFVNNSSLNQFKTSYRVTRPLFTVPDIFDPEDTWYIRVRTVTNSGVKSYWSSPLSTEVGRVVKLANETESYPLTDPNPRTGIFDGSSSAKSSIISTTGHPDPGTKTSDIYGSTNLTWKSGIVLPFTIMSFDTTTAWFFDQPALGLTIEVLRIHDLNDYDLNGPVLDQNYKVINTIQNDIPITVGWSLDTSTNEPSTFITLARQVITGFSEPDDIATVAPFITSGTRIGYRVRLTVDAKGSTKNSIYVRPDFITMYMIEVRT